jgi:hypothetical protein
MLKKRFENPEGKVVYIHVEKVSWAYPEGTLKVEVQVYPVGPGNYSGFIYTEESLDFIEGVIEKIGNRFVDEKIYGSKEVSDTLSEYINPVYPQKSN